MKYFLSLILAINVFSIVVFAQADPPPPPLIYKAPIKTELKRFIPDDKTFQITFPGVPKVTKQDDESIFVTTYHGL